MQYLDEDEFYYQGDLLEELETSTVPVYLRDSDTYRAYVNEKQRRIDDAKVNNRTRVDNLRHLVPKWKVCEPDLNSWRENLIDDRTIYNLRKETFEDDRDMPMMPSPQGGATEEGRLRDDSEHKKELRYIKKATKGVKSAENWQNQRFWAQTMKKYNRPLDGDKEVPYRSPRYPANDEEDTAPKFLKSKDPPMESVDRPPANLKSLPGKLRDLNCQRDSGLSQHFCDVLGPAVCNACLEVANRKIAGEIQRSAFPTLDCTVTTLVAPHLAKAMARGDKALKIRQRMTSSTRKNRAGNKPSILKLPPVGSGHSQFGRAGVERNFEQRAKEFFEQRQPMI